MNLLPLWWRRDFLRVEGYLALLLTLILIGLLEWRDSAAIIDTLLEHNRSALYGTLASIFGSLLGFTVTSASIILTFAATSPRFRIVRQSRHYETLWKVFSATIRVLGAATLIALIGLLLDQDHSPNRWIFYLLIVTFTLACLRVARTVWVLEQTISLVASESD